VPPRRRPPARGRPIDVRYFLLAWFGLAGLVALPGCGGGTDDTFGAGVGSGGSIQGRVLANTAGGSAGYAPLSNVYVAARRESDGLIRSTRTDIYGVYRFDGLPLGTWRLGFDAYGYGSIPVGSSSIVAYSEAGRLYQVYDVYLQGGAAAGDAQVVLTVLESGTGRPIGSATVMVGPVAGITNYAGQVTLSVPVRVDGTTGMPIAERILVSATGVDGSSVAPSWVTPIAYQTVYQTVFVSAYGSGVAGFMQATSYHQLYASAGTFGAVSITSPQIPSYYLNPVVDWSTGSFSVTVPVGTSAFYLTFSSSYFETIVVGPITPNAGGGVQQLSSPVYLSPRRQNVRGYVVSSNGPAVTGSVTVIELGMATSTGMTGEFVLSAVPVGIPLQFRASASVPYPPYTEQATVVRTVTSAGATYFELGTIVTGY